MYDITYWLPEAPESADLPSLDPHVAMSLEKLWFTDEQIVRYRSDKPSTPSTPSSDMPYDIVRDVDLMYLFSEF